jgi:acyl-CoA thioester hydrolase
MCAMTRLKRHRAPRRQWVCHARALPGATLDVLEIITTPMEVKGASIKLLQQCRRGDDLIVEARVRVAFVSGGKAQRIPKALRSAMGGG